MSDSTVANIQDCTARHEVNFVAGGYECLVLTGDDGKEYHLGFWVDIDVWDKSSYTQVTPRVLMRKKTWDSLPQKHWDAAIAGVNRWLQDNGVPVKPQAAAEPQPTPQAEASPALTNPAPAYTGGEHSPDALLAWLHRDKSALATDAADEIERLRGWLLRMYEQAARNSWHVYSCIAHDALSGKPVPERKST